MSGGSKKTQTTVQSNEPYKAAQPLLNSAIGGAQNLLKSGVGQQVYTGSTVIPFAQQSTQGMNAIQSQASAAMRPGGFSGQMGNVINQGGFTGQQQSAVNALNPFMSGRGDVSTSAINSLGNQAMNNPFMDQVMGPSMSEQNLSGIASGGFLNREDPNFERVLARASENAANSVNMSLAGAGRYGSGVHQGNLARTVGDLQADARLGQYNTERDRQVQANSLIDQQRLANTGLGMGAYQTGINQALSAAGTSAGLQGQNADRRLGAISQGFNAGQQAFNNMPTAYQNQQMPAQNMMDIGAMYEDLAGRLKNDELRIFNEAQNAPWDQLARANAIAGGAGQFGTSTNTAQTPGQNPFATGLGYASSLAGILGAF